jgi:hypothetical protein
MTPDEFKALRQGDVVVSQFNGEYYIVSGNYGDRVTAVMTTDITNPSEWHLVLRARYVQPDDANA